MLQSTSLLVVAWLTSGVLSTQAPIIGIVSQNLPPSKDYLSPGGSYIASSYVKWVEAAGGRVVPLIAGSNQNFTQLFESINGVLIPGGAASLTDSTYSELATEMFELAKVANDAGDFFPIWATCLGFEFITLASSDKERHLARCSSSDQHLPLDFLEAWEESRLFKEANSEVIDILTSMNVTANFHVWCLTMENFTKYEMDTFWTPLSLNTDKDGLEFISTIEAKNYPFYGTQFHPEKNSFEIGHYPTIQHSREAVLAGNYFAQFFLTEARRSEHEFVSRYIILGIIFNIILFSTTSIFHF
ncbi:gamma-glutamyl hydrolase [Eurytemora carolleeae]|uniref:gamma-glutamyl hydrolase n=1 Tax=Eurytemora carolleeae TaxID=1294199 RepID=UPI000C768E80|nr:gamma-glutamyl hydrolase [Eurytemora carolleeae]|eukprot:XP_023346461.1 gamma-glutamyl hydrolase-like [Eurytemora affinis]